MESKFFAFKNYTMAALAGPTIHHVDLHTCIVEDSFLQYKGSHSTLEDHKCFTLSNISQIEVDKKFSRQFPIQSKI